MQLRSFFQHLCLVLSLTLWSPLLPCSFAEQDETWVASDSAKNEFSRQLQEESRTYLEEFKRTLSAEDYQKLEETQKSVIKKITAYFWTQGKEQKGRLKYLFEWVKGYGRLGGLSYAAANIIKNVVISYPIIGYGALTGNLGIVAKGTLLLQSPLDWLAALSVVSGKVAVDTTQEEIRLRSGLGEVSLAEHEKLYADLRGARIGQEVISLAVEEAETGLSSRLPVFKGEVSEKSAGATLSELEDWVRKSGDEGKLYLQSLVDLKARKRVYAARLLAYIAQNPKTAPQLRDRLAEIVESQRGRTSVQNRFRAHLAEVEEMRQEQKIALERLEAARLKLNQAEALLPQPHWAIRYFPVPVVHVGRAAVREARSNPVGKRILQKVKPISEQDQAAIDLLKDSNSQSYEGRRNLLRLERNMNDQVYAPLASALKSTEVFENEDWMDRLDEERQGLKKSIQEQKKWIQDLEDRAEKTRNLSTRMSLAEIQILHDEIKKNGVPESLPNLGCRKLYQILQAGR